MDVVRDIALLVAGAVLVSIALDSALRTFVLPRGVVVSLTRFVTVMVRRLFDVRVRFAKTYESRDRAMALYAPVSLFVLVTVWILLVVGGFTLIFLAIEGDGWGEAFIESGSSVFTLGFQRPDGIVATTASFVAAAIGLALLALLIAYLPTIYAAFSRREVRVAYMASRSGTPPRAVDLLKRAHLINNLENFWIDWQLWFAEIEETHTSLALLNFFRSPEPNRSWITAAGTVLDTAALINSTIDVPFQPMAGLCIRSGFTALRAIAEFFRIPHTADPAPDDPICVTREEWEDACRELESVGVPLKADREQAWRYFAGWRVNYDVVLITLAGLLVAPYAEWSSDRSIPFKVRAMGRRPKG
jgi:hypothetical protein